MKEKEKEKEKRDRTVLTENHDGVFRIRLNRPAQHNVFNDNLVEDLRQAVHAANADATTRVVVLEGEGRSFCAGADVDWLRSQGEKSLADNLNSAMEMGHLFESLELLEVPLVARIHGAARGGGVGLVAVCDIAVASAAATFALPEVRLGIVPAIIGPYVIAKLGGNRARELMLTGRQFDAREAETLGLVHRVAPPDKLDEALGAVIGEIRAGGPAALRRVKRMLREVPLRSSRREELIRYTAGELAAARAGLEGREGIRAFLQKRSPTWAS